MSRRRGAPPPRCVTDADADDEAGHRLPQLRGPRRDPACGVVSRCRRRRRTPRASGTTTVQWLPLPASGLLAVGPLVSDIGEAGVDVGAAVGRVPHDRVVDGDGVVAGAAVEDVATGAVGEDVGSGAAVDAVVAISAVDGV